MCGSHRNIDSGDTDRVEEAETEIVDSQVFDETNLKLNDEKGSDSLASLLDEFVCINKDIGNALRNRLLKMLRPHYTQLNTFLENFQCMGEIRTHPNSEPDKGTAFLGLAIRTYLVAFGLEYTIYTKNPVIVLQDQVCQTEKRELILNHSENSSLCHLMNSNTGNTACLAASKRINASSQRSVF